MATNGMTINGLNPLSALTADDKIPVWDTGASGEPTKEITAQNMANSVKSLASLPNTTEMNTAIEQSTAYQSSNNAGFLRGAIDHYGLTISDQAVFVVSVLDDSESNVYVGIFWFKYGSEIFKVDLVSKNISYQAGNAQGTIAFTGITGTAKYTATRIG